MSRIVNAATTIGTFLTLAAPFAVVVTGLIVLDTRLPGQFQWIPKVVDGQYAVAAVVAFVFLFLLLCVSVWSIANIDRKQKREESFRYDQHGTLFNRAEPNIAFRVPTFKGLLENASRYIDEDERQAVLVDCGRRAAKDFSSSVADILLKGAPNGADWDGMNLNEKLSIWARYESETGWGSISIARIGPSDISVRVSHYHRLLRHPGGDLFVAFLSGYFQTVLTAIVSDHKRGDVATFSTTELRRWNRRGKDSVQIEFSLS